MARFDPPAFSVEFACYVEQTPKIAGQNRFGAGRCNIARLVGHHLVGDFWIFDAESPAKTAADLCAGRLIKAQTGNRCEEAARLKLNAEFTQPRTSVVVGDPTLPLSGDLLYPANIGEKGAGSLSPFSPMFAG